MPNSNSSKDPFNYFLRLKPVVLKESRYEWLREQVLTSDTDACLIWPYAKIKDWGRLVLPDGTREYVHIVAFWLAHKRMPKRRGLRQTCNDRSCFNPKHLVETEGIDETHYEYLKRVVPALQTDDCVLWPFAKLKENGYGFFHLPGGSICLAHRMAYKIARGRFPKNHGAHSCDTPSCFNPRHVRDATPRENTKDKARRGRQPQGETSYQAILTDEQVRAIRAEYVPGKVGYIRLGKKYGTAWENVRDIIKRKKWKHL